MRKKEWKLLITFHTTMDAMAMEQYCKERQIAGRLIPVPGEISAGCGLAWCAEKGDKALLMTVMKTAGIQEESVQECFI